MRARAAAGPMITAGFAALLALVACRGVLGIEDVNLVDGGEDSGHAAGDAAGDGAPQTDASTSDAGGADSGASTCGMRTTTRPSCTMCCGQENGVGAAAYFGFAEQGNTCACQACNGPCPSTMKVCGGSTPMAQTQCGGCVSNLEIDNRCPDLAAKCDGDPQCKKWSACIKTCGPLP